MTTNVNKTVALDETFDVKRVAFLKVVTPWDKGGKAGEIHYILGNGKQIIQKIDEVSEANKSRGLYHGMKQKVGDSVAGLSKTQSYTEAFEKISFWVERMKTEHWEKGERNTADSPQSQQDLANAIATVQKLKYEEVLEVVQEADAEQRREWRKHPAINLELQNIKIRRDRDNLKELGKEVPKLNFKI